MGVGSSFFSLQHAQNSQELHFRFINYFIQSSLLRSLQRTQRTLYNFTFVLKNVFLKKKCIYAPIMVGQQSSLYNLHNVRGTGTSACPATITCLQYGITGYGVSRPGHCCRQGIQKKMSAEDTITNITLGSALKNWVE